MEILTVKMSEINADLDFNSRKYYDKEAMDALTADIAQNGLITPLVVGAKADEKGKFPLVAGFRRYKALRKLKADVVNVSVLEGNATAMVLMNVRENLAREDLSTYELAIACARLKDGHKMSYAKVADAFHGMRGMSKSYVSRLVRCLEKAPTYVLEAWENPKHDRHKLATIPNIEDVISKSGTDEVMGMEAWEALAGKVDTGRGPKQGKLPGVEGEPAKKKMVRLPDIALAISALKDKGDELSDDEQRIVLQTLRWVCGDVKTLKVEGVTVYDPKKAKRDAEKAKKEERERAKAEKAEEKRQAAIAKKQAELEDLQAD